jgi:hypothetical protein
MTHNLIKEKKRKEHFQRKDIHKLLDISSLDKWANQAYKQAS